MKIYKLILVVLLLMVFHGVVFAEGVPLIWIDSVDVIPSQPLDTDLITFNISGGASNSPSSVAYDLFSQNGISLQLDLYYVDMGLLPTVGTWTYSKEIQPLSLATYSLEVRTFDYRIGSPWYGTLQDTYTVDFTVVPEPATILLLGFALPFLRVFSRRNF